MPLVIYSIILTMTFRCRSFSDLIKQNVISRFHESFCIGIASVCQWKGHENLLQALMLLKSFQIWPFLKLIYKMLVKIFKSLYLGHDYPLILVQTVALMSPKIQSNINLKNKYIFYARILFYNAFFSCKWEIILKKLFKSFVKAFMNFQFFPFY